MVFSTMRVRQGRDKVAPEANQTDAARRPVRMAKSSRALPRRNAGASGGIEKLVSLVSALALSVGNVSPLAYADDPAPVGQGEADRAEMPVDVRRYVIAKSSDESVFDGLPVVSEHEDIKLLEYADEQSAESAAEELSAVCEFAEADGVVMMAGDDGAPVQGQGDGTVLVEADGGYDILSQIPDEPAPESGPAAGDGQEETPAEADADADGKLRIAVIDSGRPSDEGLSAKVVEGMSVLGGDDADENGHATDMMRIIDSYSPDADYISIKVLDRNGRGSTSALYAGIEAAIAADADIINLSLYAPADSGAGAIASAVDDAVKAGKVVVASAGNEGADAAGYVPAGIDGVLTAGAVDEEGLLAGNSNYGDSVELYAVGASTSTAAAKTTGWLGANSALADPYADISAEFGKGTFFAE